MLGAAKRLAVPPNSCCPYATAVRLGGICLMSYVNQVLQDGEEVRYDASISWVIFIPGILLAILAIIIAIFASQMDQWAIVVFVLAALCGLVALLQLFSAWLRRWTTEIAVTTRRIIYKRGLIRRHTIEMHIDKVESVDVDQSLMGRLLDYGDILVHGTGVGLEPLRGIDAPLRFRNHVTGV
jgi:membrane protein YdbS with pleckstrin-like domain